MIHSTALQRRLLVEDFTRLRSPNEIRRFAASQRRGRVDANPHQIDAVAFALERIPEGGCILADEVGLGKTIEAGLITSQLFAEGMARVLLIVPKALMGQWQTELRSLFGLEVKIGAPTPDAFTGEGIFIVNREFAGGIKGAPLLSSTDPFDLAIIDEAHELFAGIHKRFDKKSGEYQVDNKHAQTAHRVYNLLYDRNTPVLLLTATPIQNNLDEIWGLVQYIERNDRLLGDLPTFRERFSLPSTDEDGLPQSLAFDLRNRLQTVVQRTLRKQAQPFLDTPFVERHAKTVEYQLTTEERQLYNDITEWLMRPDLLSYTTATRRLLVVGFHRRMTSSFAALKSSLINVANRLRKELDNTGGNAWTDAIAEFAADLEEENEELEILNTDDNDHPHNDEIEQPRDPDQIQQELELLESFIERAEALKDDTKAQRLLTALGVIREQELRNNSTGKAVIFTESIETQNYLTDYLTRNGFALSDITLFRGDNSHPRAQEALANWRNEVAAKLPRSHVPPPDVAVRLALVHEFKTRSKLLIATEAGAKGLNLQFCESLINYDLPWNPQRIEQRIGRVHRYGQTRGVFVFNLVDRGNEAANLTYDILSRKLDLFGKVLDASDDVLHTPDHTFPESLVSGIGIDFEKQVRQVYQQSSSIEDVIAQLRSLRESIDQQRKEFDETQERCAEVIESRLDDSVATIFRNHQNQLPDCLAEIDRETDVV